MQAWALLGDSERAGLAARRAAKAEAQLARLIEAGGEESGGEEMSGMPHENPMEWFPKPTGPADPLS